MSRSRKPDSYLCVSVFICGHAFASRQADTLFRLLTYKARQFAEQFRATLIIAPLLRARVIAVVEATGLGRDPDLVGGTLLVDDDLAAVREFKLENLAGIFEIDVCATGLDGMLDAAERDGCELVKFCFVHAGFPCLRKQVF